MAERLLTFVTLHRTPQPEICLPLKKCPWLSNLLAGTGKYTYLQAALFIWGAVTAIGKVMLPSLQARKPPTSSDSRPEGCSQYRQGATAQHGALWVRSSLLALEDLLVFKTRLTKCCTAQHRP